MFVLGIDPGLSRCGYCVLERGSRHPAASRGDRNSSARPVALGVLRTAPDRDLPDRLAELWDDFSQLLDEFPTAEVAVERVLFQVNVRTAMGVGQASGILMAEAARRGLTVAQYSPNQVKDAVAGHGSADKVQVQRMVQLLLDLPAPPDPPDAADAAAVALTHVALDERCDRNEGAHMIGSLRGEVLDWSPSELLVEVAGIGYRVQATPATIAAAGEVGGEAFLHVHHQIREDAETLYGFTTIDDRRVFEVLIGTHGVGPALALSILSVHSPAALRQVVATDDVAALCLVPGVGRKTAARLLVELKSRLDVPDTPADAVAARLGGSAPTARRDVRDALVELGYGPEEIASVLLSLPEDGESSDLLREALVRLAAA